MGIYIPDMDKPKNCAECFRILKCKSVPRWVTADDSIPKSCPLIEIDENDPMLLEFLNEFDKWRAYKEVMNYIKSVYKEGEDNDKRRI